MNKVKMNRLIMLFLITLTFSKASFSSDEITRDNSRPNISSLREEAALKYRDRAYEGASRIYKIIVDDKSHTISDSKNFLNSFNKYITHNHVSREQLEESYISTLSAACRDVQLYIHSDKYYKNMARDIVLWIHQEYNPLPKGVTLSNSDVWVN